MNTNGTTPYHDLPPAAHKLSNGIQHAMSWIGWATSDGSAPRLQATEGPRGYSVRASVYARYVCYVLYTVLSCALVNSLLQQVNSVSYGGKLLFYCVSLMFAVAAASTVAFPTHRREIVTQIRHYVFGLCLTPSTAIAIVIWALRGVLDGPAQQGSPGSTLLSYGLPALFVITSVMPAIVYVKAVSGYNTMHRSRMDDQELIKIHSRQDHLQH